MFQLELLQKLAKRKNDLRLYADELGKGLVGELDYTLEAANASEFLVIISFPFMFKLSMCSNNSYERFYEEELKNVMWLKLYQHTFCHHEDGNEVPKVVRFCISKRMD